jgi:hypothetical protein
MRWLGTWWARFFGCLAAAGISAASAADSLRLGGAHPYAGGGISAAGWGAIVDPLGAAIAVMAAIAALALWRSLGLARRA